MAYVKNNRFWRTGFDVPEGKPPMAKDPQTLFTIAPPCGDADRNQAKGTGSTLKGPSARRSISVLSRSEMYRSVGIKLGNRHT